MNAEKTPSEESIVETGKKYEQIVLIVKTKGISKKANLEVTVHYEVGVRQPDVLVVVDSIQEVVMGLVGISQPGVVPLLLQQKLHLVFL